MHPDEIMETDSEMDMNPGVEIDEEMKEELIYSKGKHGRGGRYHHKGYHGGHHKGYHGGHHRNIPWNNYYVRRYPYYSYSYYPYYPYYFYTPSSSYSYNYLGSNPEHCDCTNGKVTKTNCGSGKGAVCTKSGEGCECKRYY